MKQFLLLTAAVCFIVATLLLIACFLGPPITTYVLFSTITLGACAGIASWLKICADDRRKNKQQKERE